MTKERINAPQDTIKIAYKRLQLKSQQLKSLHN
jgi:hypothetical protein